MPGADDEPGCGVPPAVGGREPGEPGLVGRRAGHHSEPLALGTDPRLHHRHGAPTHHANRYNTNTHDPNYVMATTRPARTTTRQAVHSGTCLTRNRATPSRPAGRACRAPR